MQRVQAIQGELRELIDALGALLHRLWIMLRHVTRSVGNRVHRDSLSAQELVRVSKGVGLACICGAIFAFGDPWGVPHVLLAVGVFALVAPGIVRPPRSVGEMNAGVRKPGPSLPPACVGETIPIEAMAMSEVSSVADDREPLNLERLKDIEWELRDNEARYRDLLDSQTDIILRQNHDGALIFVNKAFCRVFDLDANDVIGRSFIPNVLESGVEEDLEVDPSNQIDDSALLSRRFTQKIDTSIGPRWFSWEEQSIRSGETGAIETQRIGRDITEQREVEATLDEARKQAEAASEAKSRFLAVMSHEIRTPLGGIMGMTGLLDGTHLSAEQRTYATAVKDSAKSLLSIIDEILDFSKIEAGKLTFEKHPFELDTLLQSLAELLAPRAWDKNLELTWDIDPDLHGTLVGDEHRVRQILMNLVGNAIKFTDIGGLRVRVYEASDGAADQSDAGVASAGTTTKPSVSLVFDVIDTGIGLTTEQRERIFTEFEQADTTTTRQFGGTGLGLSISRRLARSMGGDIKVVSARGDVGATEENTSRPGATFSLLLPFEITDQSVSLRQVWSSSSSQTAPRAQNVLIASDRCIEREALHDTLVALGHRVVCASSEDALSVLNKAQTLPDALDAIICDTSIYAGMRKKLCATRDVPGVADQPARALIIIDPGDREKLTGFREEGFAAYLMRPVRPKSLLSQLHGEQRLSPLERSTNANTSALDGRMSAVAEPGLDQQASAMIIGASACSNNMKGAAANILLAEDNPVNALLATRILEGMGHTVVHVENGAEAAEAIGQTRVPCNPRFDVVLMDLHMPVLDGIAACDRIFQDYKTDPPRADSDWGIPPIIALTANAFPEDRQRCLAAGMSDFITKPFEREHLARIIDEWCRGPGPAETDGSLAELNYG